MEVEDIRKVVDIWQGEYVDLGILDFDYVQIFENKGQVMGCSNPHPHGQIWAQSSIAGESAKETKQQAAYYEKHQRSLLQDYLAIEKEEKTRIIFENEHFVVLVPFETMIVSKRHFQHIGQMSDGEKDNFADALKRLTMVYDKVFNVSLPYSAGIHQSPTDGNEYPGWHFHMHFYPPLLRSATVKKFMVGYEMRGDPQRDITPETGAQMLKDLLCKSHSSGASRAV